MRRIIVLLALVMAAMVLLSAPMAEAKKHHNKKHPAPMATPDANCSATNFPFDSSVAADQRSAQTFTAINSGELTSAQMRVNKDAGSIGDYLLEVRTVDASGAPTSTILASTPIPNSTVPDGFSTITGDFGSPATVVAGQQYALDVGRPGSTDDLVVDAGGGNPPCLGKGYEAPTSAGPFTEDTAFGGLDYFFATFVTPADGGGGGHHKGHHHGHGHHHGGGHH
jgi:hypothetical protein